MSTMIRGGKANNRKFPGVKGRRPDHKALRVREAAERNASYQALPIEAKATINPKKFSKD